MLLITFNLILLIINIQWLAFEVEGKMKLKIPSSKRKMKRSTKDFKIQRKIRKS